jgi:hypothetical protein
LPDRSMDRCNFIVFTPAKQNSFVAKQGKFGASCR